MADTRGWWERQGYKKDHAVHSGTDFYVKNVGDNFEGEVEEIKGAAQRGGGVGIQVAPTRTSNPGRPRTLAAGYDGRTNTLRIDFRDGATYEYYDVSRAEWWRFRRSASPGKFINRVLPDKEYFRVSG